MEPKSLSKDMESTVEIIIDECLAIASLEGLEIDRQKCSILRSLHHIQTSETTTIAGRPQWQEG